MENGQIFSLKTSITNEQLRQLSKEHLFFCPQCNGRVILKIGQFKIPHFAHVQKEICARLFSEGETIEHLLGKRLLFDFFQLRNKQVELEAYLPHLKQRPDLLVKNYEKATAIEFQCSNISLEIFKDRTEGYRLHGINVHWLPLTPKKIFQNGMGIVHFNKFLQLFLRQWKRQIFLRSFSPMKEQFVYFNHVMHIYQNRFIADIQRLDLKNQCYPFLTPPYYTRQIFMKQFQLYRTELKKIVEQRVRYSRLGVQDPFLRAMYELRVNRLTLPDFIGIPIRFLSFIKLSSAEWQLLFFYYMHIYHIDLATLDKAALVNFLKWIGEAHGELQLEELKGYQSILLKLGIKDMKSSVTIDEMLVVAYDQIVAI